MQCRQIPFDLRLIAESNVGKLVMLLSFSFGSGLGRDELGVSGFMLWL